MPIQAILGLDAVILIANDFDGQCTFYRDTLGLEMISEYDDAAFFGVGKQVFGIFAKSHHPEGSKRLGAGSHGISHLEFRLNRIERKLFVSRLRAAGAQAYGENFADADGNLFHFNYSTRKWLIFRVLAKRPMRKSAVQRVLGLDAVILIANDFEGQFKFYNQTLGLQMISQYGDAAFFRVGKQVVGIFARSHHPEGTRRLGAASHGISHLEFRVDKEERSSFMTKLKAAGAHAYGECFADADGNLFHFNILERAR